tara:strand:+ start:166 stop:411 length:246 start_codon:yes stop_codon:yes gene_type:complete
MKKIELKLNNLYKDWVCEKTGQYISPTHIIFEAENGGLIHPTEAIKEGFTMSEDTYNHIINALDKLTHNDKRRKTGLIRKG